MNKISSKHFILFIIGVAFISVKTYPSIFIDIGGRDTWLASLIASIIFVIFLMYIINICVSTKTFDINDIFARSMPKAISVILMLIFTITLFINAIESAAVEANVLHSTLFLETPVWYSLIFFILPSLFIFNKRLRTILIFVLVSVFVIIINGIVFFALTQSYKDINNLLPVLGNGISSGFTVSLFLILGGFSSFMIAIPFLKYINEFEHIRKHTLYAGVITSAFVVISIIGVITAFGPLRSANIFYPEFILGQRIEVAGFLEFGELFFIIQTVLGFFIKYVLATYSILLILGKYIKDKRLFIGIYTFIVFVLSSFLGMNNYVLYDVLKYLQIINLFSFILIPLIVFSTYYFKFKSKEKLLKDSK